MILENIVIVEVRKCAGLKKMNFCFCWKDVIDLDCIYMVRGSREGRKKKRRVVENKFYYWYIKF